MTETRRIHPTMRARVAAVLLVAVSLAVACAGGLEHPVARDVEWSRQNGLDVTMEDLTAGRSVYVQKCAGCHHLHRAEEYAPDRWDALVGKMASRAKLSAEERRLISTYLSATSARLREPAAAVAGAGAR